MGRLASVLDRAACEPTAHGLWISSPEIRFYTKEARGLSLSTLGTTVRAESGRISGDFVVSKDTADALRALVAQAGSDTAH